MQLLVAKPDQLIKRRGKLGLVKVKLDFDAAKAWIHEHMHKDITVGRQPAPLPVRSTALHAETHTRPGVCHRQVGKATGKLHHFVLEPFVAHEQARVVTSPAHPSFCHPGPHSPPPCPIAAQSDEYYLCIYAERHHNTILFHHEGGVDIGDVDAKATKLHVGLTEEPTADHLKAHLLAQVPPERQE